MRAGALDGACGGQLVEHLLLFLNAGFQFNRLEGLAQLDHMRKLMIDAVLNGLGQLCWPRARPAISVRQVCKRN